MTKSDIEKLIEYLQSDLPKMVFDERFNDGEKTVEKGAVIYCKVTTLFDVLRDYPVKDEKTCGPNYKAMYEHNAQELDKALQTIESMKLDNKKLLIERTHLAGAVAAMETIFGRKFDPRR